MTGMELTTPKERKEWLRRFNRKVTNPIMMSFAGKRFYTVVEHVGRRSKRIYQTPVMGQPAGEGFVIPLPYGADTDWCLNVLAAGGGRVRWNGQVWQLTCPQIVGQAEGEAVYSGVLRFLLHASGVQKYLNARRG